MRGKLINPFLAEIAQLDTEATMADPDGPGPATSGYDADFKETVVLTAPGSPRLDARKEKSPIRLPCQVEVGTFDALNEMAGGNSPNSRITLVFHFRDLEARGLVEPSTGEARLRINDRLVALYTMHGQLVQAIRTPPGLYATEVQPQSFGIGLSRNLLLVMFDEREVAVRGAA